MEIKVTVRNKRASGDNSVIVCGNSDYSVKFDLDSEWDAFSTKTMLVVCNDGTTYSVQFEGDTANLPALYNIHDIRIGIMAGNIHTTTGAYFRCYLSIKDVSGASVEPPEDVYAQLVEALTGKITEPAEEGADGQVLTTDGKGGRSWKSASGGGIDVTGAKAGQIVKVSAVDENGKPTGWIPVDIPEQKQPDWSQNDTAAADYVKNRPFYSGDPVETVLVEESTVAFEDGGSMYLAKWPESLDWVEGRTYTVKFDGTSYDCVCRVVDGSMIVIGNLSIAGAGDDSGEPFIIINQGSWMTGTSDTSASHVISISKSVQEVKKIDSKYIDFPAETDPTVPTWAKDDHKPTYTASEVGALPSDTVIPVIITYDASGNLSHTFSQIQTLISNGKTCIVLDKKNGVSYLYFGNGSNYINFRNSNKQFSISKSGTVSITDPAIYDLPVASSTTRGGIRLGDGLKIKELDSDVVSVSDDYVNTLIDEKLNEEIPTELPNPAALTFTGAVTGSYNGSEAVTVKIPSGGGSEEKKEWSQIANVDLSLIPKGNIELTGLENYTDFYIMWETPKNESSTASSFGLEINGKQIVPQSVPIVNQSAGNSYGWLKANYDGLVWNVLKSNGAIDSANRQLNYQNSLSPFNHVLDVGKATTFKLIAPLPNYAAVSGTIKVYGR